MVRRMQQILIQGMCEYSDGGENAVDSITMMGRMQQMLNRGMCHFNNGGEDEVDGNTRDV